MQGSEIREVSPVSTETRFKAERIYEKGKFGVLNERVME